MKAKANKKYDFEIVTATMPPRRNNTNSKYKLHQLSEGNAYRIPADHESVQRTKRGSCRMLSAVAGYNKRHYKNSELSIRTRRYANDDLWVGVAK